MNSNIGTITKLFLFTAASFTIFRITTFAPCIAGDLIIIGRIS